MGLGCAQTISIFVVIPIFVVIDEKILFSSITTKIGISTLIAIVCTRVSRNNGEVLGPPRASPDLCCYFNQLQKLEFQYQKLEFQQKLQLFVHEFVATLVKFLVLPSVVKGRWTEVRSTPRKYGGEND